MSVRRNGGSAPPRRKILLTGGSGFVGRATAAALVEAGHEVHVASRRVPLSDVASKAAVHTADLLQEDAARRLIAAVAPEVVLHLAWCVTPGHFWTDPANLDWITASLRLARAAAEGGVSRFVGVGTCFEYDWPANAPCVEGLTPLRVHTLYDAAKASLAATLRAYLATTSTRFAWARLSISTAPAKMSAASCRASRARCCGAIGRVARAARSFATSSTCATPARPSPRSPRATLAAM